MEQLYGGYTLDIPPGCFPLSTDSMALADFVRLGKNARVLDLGSGCGTLGLLLCAGDPGCHVTGVELDPVAHEAALENIHRNGLEARLESICGDIAQLHRMLPPGGFSVCVSNPPYFSGGPASAAHPTARREDRCDPGQLMQAAARSLKFGGDFFLVHRPERLAELCAAGAAQGLEAKRLSLLRHRQDGPVALVLLQLRKGAKPGLIWEEQYLWEADGTPSGAYQKINHL